MVRGKLQNQCAGRSPVGGFDSRPPPLSSSTCISCDPLVERVFGVTPRIPASLDFVYIVNPFCITAVFLLFGLRQVDFGVLIGGVAARLSWP